MGMIGVGRFDVKVVRTGLGEAGEGKNPQIIVQFEDEEGNTISAYLFCTEKAWPYTEEKLQNMGWDPVQHGYRFEELNEDPSPIAGNAAEIVTDEETYDGKTRTKVKFINPPGGRIERMEAGEAQAFAAKLRQRLLGGNSQQADQPPPPSDEDVPF